MSKTKSFVAVLTAALCAAGSCIAQVNLTAETAAPVAVAGNTVLGLSEATSSAGVANLQVATGQTLTNSIQNVAEGKTDIASSPFILTFLMSRGAGPYAKLGPEKGAELAGSLAVLYTYRFGVHTLSAFESKNFAGWEAIEGATIYNGPPRGAALTRARSVVKIAVVVIHVVHIACFERLDSSSVHLRFAPLLISAPLILRALPVHSFVANVPHHHVAIYCSHV